MRIYVTSDAHAKVWAFVRTLNTEVGGFGYAKRVEDGLLWYDTFLVPQEVSHSEVSFDGGGIAAAVERAASDGVLGAEDHVWVSWHSHHTMKAFWSATDEKCIETYRDAGIANLISFVGCHDHEYRLRFDMFGVEHHGITMPQVTIDELTLLCDPADELFGSIFDEIAKNVRKTKPATTTSRKAAPVKSKVVSAGALTDAKGVADAEQLDIDEAFEVRDLMNEGVTYDDAVELVKGGYEIGPGDVVSWGGFDQMAWGD